MGDFPRKAFFEPIKEFISVSADQTVDAFNALIRDINANIGIGGAIDGLSITRPQIATEVVLPATFMVSGFTTPGDLGAGAIYTSQGATSGSLMAIQSASGIWYRLVITGYANIGWFGAIGDGVTDDTEAIQTCITYIVLNHKVAFFPSGTYKISATINFQYTYGWSVQGCGPGSTIIVQETDNIPIFNLGSDTLLLTHTWAIDGVAFTYTNVQPSTNTNANPILFSQMLYQGRLTNICFIRGSYAIRVANTIWAPWGTTWDNLWFTTELTGGAMDWSQCGGAVPNNHFGRIYCQCSNMVGPVFTIRGYNFVIDTLEFNQALLSPVLFRLAAGAVATINAIKIEGFAYTSSTAIFDFQASAKAIIGQVSVGGAISTVSNNAVLTIVSNGSGGVGDGFVDIDQMTITPSSVEVGSAIYAISGGPISIGHISITDAGGRTFLLNQGSSSTSESTIVTSHINGHLSQDLGNADFTATLGGTNKCIFQTAFTAARTINLPTANYNNFFNGLYYEFIFNGAINGANTATIKSNGATLHTQTTDKVVVGFTYRRFAANPQGGWILTKYETLP